MSTAVKTHQDQPVFAALLIVGSYFFLAFQDALVKVISSEVSLWQFMVLRALLNGGFFGAGNRFAPNASGPWRCGAPSWWAL